MILSTFLPTLVVLLRVSCVNTHQVPLAESTESKSTPPKPAADFHPTYDGPTWEKKYGSQYDLSYTGPLSFSHLPYERCLDNASLSYDIAILGLPFDTAVTYRSGARFGPFAIRSGSRRQHSQRGYTLSWADNPYTHGERILDCGDVPVNPFDNALAVDQMEVAYSTLLARPATRSNTEPVTRLLAKDGVEHPRIISLGGDHTIVLPILRSLHRVYGPISVIHFDAHLDTWATYPGQTSEQARVTHGTFFYLAKEEGLLAQNNIHAGIRCKMTGIADMVNDETVGFQAITADDLDDIGSGEIINKIKKRIGDSPVYLSLDIDVIGMKSVFVNKFLSFPLIDPGLAPATGTPEPGGWTTRELKRIIRGLAGLNFVGADIVEVAPAYDHADITGIAAADLVHDFLSLFLAKSPPQSRHARVDDEL
ncbi:arginase deacetylase [Crepidotus variabilis]|uniref:Arginase deacetylase n=1 Tax=Crepidotus variabilis TaxID=179855 RepID=A0A9P6JTG6_9AGAR|nr:arginase deacetylase [Crepidotus variabilis]